MNSSSYWRRICAQLVRETEKLETQEEVDRILSGIEIPVRDNP